MIDLEKMAKQHEKLFPNATLESQIAKMEEEIEEFGNAKTVEEQRQELADVIIVCAGLYRWCRLTAQYLALHFLEFDYNDTIEEEVNRKWQINLKRKWEWNGKTYHHVEK